MTATPSTPSGPDTPPGPSVPSGPSRPTGPPLAAPPPSGPWRRRLRSWRRWILIVICAALLAAAIRVETRMVTKSFASFGHLHLRPLIFAVVMEVLSMMALAFMERRILIMAGVRLPVHRAVAIAYASNALSASLPMVGSSAASAFTYRRMVSQGATPVMAGWALILGGIASNAVFVVIICIGGIFSGSDIGAAAGAAGIVATIVIVWLVMLAMRRPKVQERFIRASVWTVNRMQRTIRRPVGDPASLVASSVSGLGSFVPHRSDVLWTVYSALRNWTFDLLCLAFSIKAAGVRVPWWGIVLAWAAGAGGSSLSLTPGGLGVVEAALTGALVALGVPAAPALTAVLIYRGITFWLAVAIGWTVYLVLRRTKPPATAPPAGHGPSPP
ncbi:MAG: flippase-like domain-containing protein [Actinobacteria bacterium]|nr:flippase-like domain-containing protein [Actinomycetota bacterium]